MDDTSDTKWVAYGSSTTSPVDNTERREVKIPQVKLLFLLFWVKGKFGGYLYSEGAKTRMHNIKNSSWYDEHIHEVHCPDIEDVSEILDIIPRYISKFGGALKVRTKEVSYHSHAGGDGPIGSANPAKYSFGTPGEFGQMKLDGWESIDFNWDSNCPRFILYGCDSALEAPPVDHPNQKAYKNFAKTLSTKKNFENVEVWGQSTKSAPSFLPDYRVTSAARDMRTGWSVGATFQVAAGMNGGWKATDLSGYILDPDPDREYIKKHFDPVQPMYCYKNGEKIRSIHQGYYNDHRKKV
ncbi:MULTISPECIES: hypothetical protein [unclassified Caballeronia]|uniref:hypothetical protein n=1 Tax=unclassified Caballeronia TaxID=2646786 RepID=UPI00285671E6|nr:MULTISPECIES: hypothetical protein [unclassified Caballeronia]MDR5752905.1 hypothetical protein [Caballeronia sp. LZ024]MDR5841192.1 hypothetical protein [Caballeronia sp. LZ031]